MRSYNVKWWLWFEKRSKNKVFFITVPLVFPLNRPTPPFTPLKGGFRGVNFEVKYNLWFWSKHVRRKYRKSQIIWKIVFETPKYPKTRRFEKLSFFQKIISWKLRHFDGFWPLFVCKYILIFPHHLLNIQTNVSQRV